MQRIHLWQAKITNLNYVQAMTWLLQGWYHPNHIVWLCCRNWYCVVLTKLLIYSILASTCITSLKFLLCFALRGLVAGIKWQHGHLWKSLLIQAGQTLQYFWPDRYLLSLGGFLSLYWSQIPLQPNSIAPLLVFCKHRAKRIPPRCRATLWRDHRTYVVGIFRRGKSRLAVLTSFYCF